MTATLLDKEATGIVVVDIQEKLMPVINHKEKVTGNIIKLLHLSKVYDLPVILTEQYPKWLGPTLQEITKSLPVYEPIKKMDFNCCAVAEFKSKLDSARLKNLILTGVESHICIYQTCTALLKIGYNVYVPGDAVGSRTDENHLAGIELMSKADAVITSTETVIFQILKKAGTKEFKEMMKVIK